MNAISSHFSDNTALVEIRFPSHDSGTSSGFVAKLRSVANVSVNMASSVNNAIRGMVDKHPFATTLLAGGVALAIVATVPAATTYLPICCSVMALAGALIKKQGSVPGID
ncbi:hypothetical protein [Candidatus Sodalis sp. SoCistrobi]|uniref:hypothetical protein n=1 Tax=Candidatus Sodalis sp. SoCistrobi TaxID=1922216 RepID=UPI000F7869F8|nr:hypothetical protein [Candidatus Sodalis sp. SoCistrobi]